MSHSQTDPKSSSQKESDLIHLRDAKVTAVRDGRKHSQHVMMVSSGLAAFSAQILKSGAIDELQSTYCILAMVCFLITAAIEALLLSKVLEREYEFAALYEKAIKTEDLIAACELYAKEMAQEPKTGLRGLLLGSPIYIFLIGCTLLIAATLYMINVEKIVQFFWPMFHQC